MSFTFGDLFTRGKNYSRQKYFQLKISPFKENLTIFSLVPGLNDLHLEYQHFQVTTLVFCLKNAFLSILIIYKKGFGAL